MHQSPIVSLPTKSMYLLTIRKMTSTMNYDYLLLALLVSNSQRLLLTKAHNTFEQFTWNNDNMS